DLNKFSWQSVDGRLDLEESWDTTNLLVVYAPSLYVCSIN
ncbi:MAG: hypothetical protein ACI85U_004018, partial [Candidatus Promineifilaceae bacterium]